jgi:hypothetical protein
VRASRRTRIVRRGELVRVAQLALVVEVVDSARAHQVGGHVDALATPAAVGRGSQWSVMRCSHARRAGSGRAAVGSGQGGQAHPSCPASSKSKRETVVSRILRQPLDPVFCGGDLILKFYLKYFTFGYEIKFKGKFHLLTQRAACV